MKVLVVDYQMSNLGSLRRSLEECGAEVTVSTDSTAARTASHLILPGVGAFPDGMANLAQLGWIPELHAAARAGVPLLGICLGMQLLAGKGYEGEETAGLGLIAGEVKRFEAPDSQTRIPHVGWNEARPTRRNPLFAGITDAADFYFVHSYHLVAAQAADVIATTDYCGGFVSAVMAGHTFGVQFHPEKSSRAGFQILKNFLRL